MSKGGGEIVIGFGKPKPGDEGSKDEEAPESSDEESTEEDVAADELADAIGVSEDKRADFKSALASYIAICVAREMKE